MIETKNLYRTYGHGETRVTALKSINLKVEGGGFVAIMGPSGSGKSTLLNILGCLDTPTKGKYYLSGVDTGKLNEDEKAALRRNTIGFVFQSFNLLPRLSAYANVELPLIYGGIEKSQRHERVMQMLEMVKMSDRSKHLPGELSGGQKQRTAIARALVLDPKLILADEPTGNLDQKTGESIMELFKKLNKKGKTIILITHDAMIAEHANNIAQIKDGIFTENIV
ncbi:MAG: ABC transporter ATP-binding protein [Eubacteriales bacterium]